MSIADSTRRDAAALVELQLTSRCLDVDDPGRHKLCDHHIDALTAVDTLITAGWRPNLAELEDENRQLRERLDDVALDRDLLRAKLRETPA